MIFAATMGLRMLMLLFYVKSELYAIESSSIVAIIPKVSLRKVHHLPEYVAGIFNYRGTILPVIDLCHLIQGSPSHSHLSTRIMIVNYTSPDGTLKQLGLMAERVTETLNRSEDEIVDLGVRVDAAPYLSGTIIDSNRIIQCIKLECLFSDPRHTNLLTGSEN